MISIFAIQLLFQVSSYLLIMDNQVKELSLYKVVNDDSEITIWVRFQTQYVFQENPQEYTSFFSINSQISKETILLKYQYNSLLQIIITVPNQEFTENLISARNYDRQTWLSINLLKDQELQWINAQNKTIQLPQIKYKDRWYYGNLITYQNLTFSLKAYKGSDQTNQQDSFYVQNNPILKLQKQIVMNYKSQIQLEMYLRQQYEDEQLVFIINDQEYNYYLFYGHSNIRIKIKSDFSLNWKQFQGIPHNQWFKLRIHFELDKTITSVNTISDQFEWVYENKQMKPIDGQIPQYYGLIIYLYYMYVEIDNIVIVNNRSQQITNICFPGCKKCEELECLECENNLKLSNQCSCNINQFYDNQIELCKDITEHPGLIQNQKKIQICKLNEYFNTQLEKCIQCPRIDEYYCTDCVFNTELWKVYKTCTFQEIYSDLFLKYQSLNYDLNQNTFQLIFDKFYTKITNIKCDFQQEYGLIQCKKYAWDHLVYDICDQGQYNQLTHKCNSKKGIFHQFQNRIMCQQNYTLIKFRCIKCPHNCAICIYNQNTIKCVIANQGFYVYQNHFLVQRCVKNTSMCSSEINVLQNQKEQKQLQKDCKLQMNQTCLLCVDKYILDLKLNCIQGQIIGQYYQFEFYTRYLMKLSQYQLMQISQDTLLDTIAFQQIMFYSKQYENIKQNQLFNKSDGDSNCVQYLNFNLSQKCIIYNNTYTQLYNNDIIYYCPNDYCSYNITLNLTILISNRQEVIYKNSIYYNIQDLLDNLQVPLYILEITLIVQAYAFDSFDQKCYDHQVFLLDQNKKALFFPNTLFKLIITFQTYSHFPECWNKNFYSNFDFIEIRNLITDNQLQIEFHSYEIRLIDSQFSNNNIEIVADAQIISLENIEFINSIFNNSLLYIINHNQIQEIQFLSCKFVNITIYENTILIKILQQAQKIRIRNLTIFLLVIDESQFIQFYYFNQLIIDQVLMAKLDTILATLFSCSQILYDSQIDMSQITIVDSDFWYSNFYQIHGQANIYNVRITNCMFQNSQIFNINDRALFNDIQFQGLILDRSFLINCKNQHNNIILKEIKIINSYFNQTTSSISIVANNIRIVQFLIYNCNYYPPLNLLDIKAQSGAIKYLNLTNINIEKIYQQQIVLLPDYLLNFEIENFILNFSIFKNIIIDQVKLLHIQYQTAQIKTFVIKNFSLIGESLNELIMFSELNKESYFKLHSLEVKNVSIKWLYLSKLLHLQGNHGVFLIQNAVIKNITSTFQHQIFFSSRNKLFLINIDNEFQPFIGLIKQYQSKIVIQNHKQTENVKFPQQSNIPLFSNIDPVSEYEFLTIINALYINLRQPIMKFIHNKKMQLQIRSLNIYNTSTFQDLFVFELENYKNLEKITIVFYIFIDKVYVRYNYNKLQKFVSCEFSQIRLNQIVFLNTSLTILYGTFNGLTRVMNIYIQNSNLTEQIFFYIRNINSHFIAQNIYLYNQMGQCKIFKFQTYSLQRQKYYFIQIREVFIKQCIGCSSFVETDNAANFKIYFIFSQYIITESNFVGNLFQLVSNNQYLFNINNIQVYNTQLLAMVQFIEKVGIQQINMISFINVIFVKEIKGNYQFYNSYIQNSTFDGLQVVLINKQMVLNYNQKLFQQPISLSFSEFGVFQSSKIEENLYQVIFNKNQTIAYVPTGIPLSEFRYNNPITYLQESPYHNFIIVLNMQQDQINCSLKQSINDQPGNYSNMNQFELQNGVNIIQNFTFKMNPYLSYPYIQNDITCNNNTIRFNVRTFPCQLGEYLYQNQCQICDITKNYYSVTKRAQLCNIINQDYIESLNVGNIKLRPACWRAKVDSSKIEQCNNEQCLGGWTPGDQSCSIGYLGALCKECDIYNIRGQGKYVQMNTECQLCQYDSIIVLKGVLVLFWLMLLTYLSVDANNKITQQYIFYKITQKNVAEILMRQSINQVSIIIKIMTNYIFYLYLFRDQLNFLFQKVNISFDFISNPSLIIRPHLDCFLVEFHQLSIQYIQLIFALISPLYILSLFYLAYLLLLKFRIMKFQFSFIIITIFSIYLFNQQLIFQLQVQLYTSKTFSNIKWIQLNQQFQFNTKEHSKILWYLIIPSNILLILIPVLLFIILKYQDKKSIRATKYFGILFKEYKMQQYYWEILRIFQRYIMILLVYQFENEYIILYIQMIYGLFIFSQPYPLKNLNRFESQTLYFLTSILINVLYMKDHSNYIRAILFFILNSILLKNAIQGIIRGSQLQYKTQLLKLKIAITQRIPISRKYINSSRSISLQRSIDRMRQSYVNQKLNIQSKTLYTQGEILFTTNRNNLQSQSEVEMLNFLHK